MPESILALSEFENWRLGGTAELRTPSISREPSFMIVRDTPDADL
jgi:hypothetical protein